MPKQKKKNRLSNFISGGKFFLCSAVFFLLSFFIFCSGGEKTFEIKSVLEKLPPEIAGFDKMQIQEEGGKEKSFRLLYMAPSGLCFQVKSTFPGKKSSSDDPENGENKKIMEKLFQDRLAIARKNAPQQKLTVKTVFSKPLTIPCLAGFKLRGYWKQYILKGEDGSSIEFRADHFMAFYRGNILQIEFLCTDDFISPVIREKFFTNFAFALGAVLYEGEKISVPESLQILLFSAFEKLLSDPLDAGMEARALAAFAGGSHWVTVNVRNNDFVWHKSLARGNGKEKKYAFLLLASYMAGNAVAQVREGICLDKRDEGMKIMKKVYTLIKEKDRTFSIPELEK